MGAAARTKLLQVPCYTEMNNKDADFSQMSRHYQFSKHRYRVICVLTAFNKRRQFSVHISHRHEVLQLHDFNRVYLRIFKPQNRLLQMFQQLRQQSVH